jgi:hypothetical protein
MTAVYVLLHQAFILDWSVAAMTITGNLRNDRRGTVYFFRLSVGL